MNDQTWIVAHGQDEWENDRKSLPAMTSRVFYLAVFELIGTSGRVDKVCLAVAKLSVLYL